MRTSLTAILSLASLIAAVTVAASACGISRDKPTAYDFVYDPCASELTVRFVHGDIVDKLGLATWFRNRSCTEAIPYLVAELRTQYDGIRCAPLPQGARDYERACLWTNGGRRLGKVDLYNPIVAALGTLCGAPCYWHGADWLDVLQDCVEVNTPANYSLIPSPRSPPPAVNGCSPQLLDRLASSDPIDKMGAAFLLGERGCRNAVPKLLAEIPYFKNPPGPAVICDMDCPAQYVSVDGKKVPRIDYHEPILRAVSILSVDYFEPDNAWYAEVEKWIRDNLSKDE